MLVGSLLIGNMYLVIFIHPTDVDYDPPSKIIIRIPNNGKRL